MRTRRRGRRIALTTGVCLLVLVGWYHSELRTWYLFWKQFESLGRNDQGYPEYRHRQFGIVMVRVPGGTFTMGSREGENGRRPDEIQHEVSVSPFLIAKYEVTQEQWAKVTGTTPSRFKKGADLPVKNVSWNDCSVFCEKTGLTLPTEAQWEYACRAGTSGPCAGTGNLDDMGWYGGNSDSKAHPVGGKEPNDFGLHDMHGNVWEWCRDWYGGYDLPVQHGDGERQVLAEGARYRVVRGGGFNDSAGVTRSALRNYDTPGLRNNILGLRPARVIER